MAGYVVVPYRKALSRTVRAGFLQGSLLLPFRGKSFARGGMPNYRETALPQTVALCYSQIQNSLSGHQ